MQAPRGPAPEQAGEMGPKQGRKNNAGGNRGNLTAKSTVSSQGMLWDGSGLPC